MGHRVLASVTARCRLRPSRSISRRSFFFFQAEDGIRDHCVTGVQTCALPISGPLATPPASTALSSLSVGIFSAENSGGRPLVAPRKAPQDAGHIDTRGGSDRTRIGENVT